MPILNFDGLDGKGKPPLKARQLWQVLAFYTRNIIACMNFEVQAMTSEGKLAESRYVGVEEALVVYTRCKASAA